MRHFVNLIKDSFGDIHNNNYMKNPYILKFIFLNCFLWLSLSSFSQDVLSPGEHYAPVNGVKIHYYVAGHGPVCLVTTPGWGPAIELYRKSLKPLEKYFTMVWYDSRFSGKSTAPADTTKFGDKDLREDMDALRLYLKQDKVWIMGHSGGGHQVFDYGIYHNDKLNGIIAIASIVGFDSVRTAQYRKLMTSRKSKPYYEKVNAVYSGKDKIKRGADEKLRLTMPFYFHDGEKAARVEALGGLQINDKLDEYSGHSDFMSGYLFPELHKITVPTLIIAGDDDFICDNVSQSARAHANIVSSDLIVIKDSGHFPWIEQPKQFFSEVSEWIKKHV